MECRKVAAIAILAASCHPASEARPLPRATTKAAAQSTRGSKQNTTAISESPITGRVLLCLVAAQAIVAAVAYRYRPRTQGIQASPTPPQADDSEGDRYLAAMLANRREQDAKTQPTAQPEETGR